MGIALAVLLIAARPLAGDADFVEGVRLYNGLRFEEASARFAAAVTRPGLEDRDLAAALVWLAISRANGGDMAAARAVLDRAFALDKTAAVPVEVSPRITSLIDERRAHAPDRPPDKRGVAPAPAAPATQSAAAGSATSGAGWAVLGVGGLCLAGSAAAAGVGLFNYSVAANPDEFYPTARAALTTSQTMAVLAGGLVAVGALSVAGGAALLVIE